MNAALPCIPHSELPRRGRRKDARPGELLDAALDLFVDKGYAATRVEEVAARAGVNAQTFKFEGGIGAHPTDWHMLQPFWPGDFPAGHPAGVPIKNPPATASVPTAARR